VDHQTSSRSTWRAQVTPCIGGSSRFLLWRGIPLAIEKYFFFCEINKNTKCDTIFATKKVIFFKYFSDGNVFFK
jgi:hypothetical protein